MNKEQAYNKIIDILSDTKELSKTEYKELLEEVVSDFEVRIDAIEVDINKEEKENEEDCE